MKAEFYLHERTILRDYILDELMQGHAVMFIRLMQFATTR
jgi:hypothetical protein